MLTGKFEEALVFANELHKKQTRNSSNIPYVSHLISVAGLVMENGGDEAQVIAGLLHDAIEDQSEQYGNGQLLGDEIERRFGRDVRNMVEACSDSLGGDKGEWKARKIKYVESIRLKSSRTALVSAADKVHNARSIIADLRKVGLDVFERFTGKREGTLWYYKALAQEFQKSHPSFLGDELMRLADEMSSLSERLNK